MIPVVPFVLLFLMIGLEELPQVPKLRTYGRVLSATIQFGTPILFLVFSLVIVGFGRIPKEEWQPYDSDSTEMFQWIHLNTAPNDVVAFFKPRAMHLLGGRLSLTATVEDIAHVSYFVYTNKRKFNESQPTLEQYRSVASLMLMFQNQNFQVYRVSPNQPLF